MKKAPSVVELEKMRTDGASLDQIGQRMTELIQRAKVSPYISEMSPMEALEYALGRAKELAQLSSFMLSCC